MTPNEQPIKTIFTMSPRELINHVGSTVRSIGKPGYVELCPASKADANYLRQLMCRGEILIEVFRNVLSEQTFTSDEQREVDVLLADISVLENHILEVIMAISPVN
jgi:hypothetical protein